MITGSCHCGNIKFELSVEPSHLTECNCSICRRIGALWVHAEISDVNIICDSGEILDYMWGDKTLAFCTCANCGCTTHWKSLDSKKYTRMAVNCRMAELGSVDELLIRHFDGADSFEYLD